MEPADPVAREGGLPVVVTVPLEGVIEWIRTRLRLRYPGLREAGAEGMSRRRRQGGGARWYGWRRLTSRRRLGRRPSGWWTDRCERDILKCFASFSFIERNSSYKPRLLYDTMEEEGA